MNHQESGPFVKHEDRGIQNTYDNLAHSQKGYCHYGMV